MFKSELIIYTNHLRLRMKLRKVPHELPKRIYLNAKDRFLDIITEHYVAVMRCEINNRYREVALSYDEKDKIVELITIHPIRAAQKVSRISSGRWRKL